MKLKRIGNSDEDFYQSQDGLVYNRAGDLIHDRKLPESELAPAKNAESEIKSHANGQT